MVAPFSVVGNETPSAVRDESALDNICYQYAAQLSHGYQQQKLSWSLAS